MSRPRPDRMRRQVLALKGTRQSLLPNGRLSDAGFTRQEQGARAGRDRVQEAMKDRELGLAPDDVTGQRRSPRVGGPQDCRDSGSEPCRPVTARSRLPAMYRMCTESAFQGSSRSLSSSPILGLRLTPFVDY